MEAKARGRQGHPRRPALHPHQRGGRPARAASGPAATSPSSAGSSTTSSRTSVSSASTSSHYTNAAGDRRRGLPRHRGPRRPVLRLRPRDAAPTTRRSWQYDGMRLASDAGAARAPASPAGEAHGARRRPSCPRQPAAHRPDAAASRAASSSSSSGTSRATPRRWSSRSAACPREQFLEVAEALCAQLGPRAHQRLLLRRRLDAAHGRRAVHPHRRDPPAAARQHRPARRRHHGPARPRHRSRARPTSRRSTTSCPATCRCRTPRRTADAARTTSSTTPPPAGFWGQLDAYIVSLLKAWWGDARHRRATTSASTTCRASDRRPLGLRRRRWRCSTATVQGLLRDGREPGRRLGQRAAAAARPWRKLDWLVVRDLVEIETATFWYDAPEIETGELRTEDIGTEVFFLPGGRPHREGRHLHQHPAAAAVAPQGGRAAGRLPLGAVVHLPPRPPDPGEAGRLDRAAGPAACST